MLVGFLDLQGHFTEATFKDVLKVSFVTQFVNNRYEMYCEMGISLIQMLY